MQEAAATTSSRRKRRLRAIYDRAAPTYGRTGPAIFDHFGQLLIERASLRPGHRVLDIASGRGACRFPAEREVGPTGKVFGVDLSTAMLLQSDPLQDAPLELDQKKLAVMDAESLGFASSRFDVATCAFALDLFPNPTKALEEMHRVIRPGGRVAFSLWQEDYGYFAWLAAWLRGDNDLARKEETTIPASSIENEVPLISSESTDSNQAFRNSSHSPLLGTLLATGFEHVEVHCHLATFVFTDPAQWWASLWSHGFREHLERRNAFFLYQLKNRGLEAIRKLQSPKGIEVSLQAWMILGRKS